MRGRFPKARATIVAAPYGLPIHIYTDRETYNRAAAYLDHTSEPVDVSHAGRFEHWMLKDTGHTLHTVGWFDDDPLSLMHEMLHVALSVLDYVGVQHSADNAEALCYLHGDLMAQALKRMGLTCTANPRTVRNRSTETGR